MYEKRIKKAEAEADNDVHHQLTFFVLGGMTMSGVIAWMRPALVAEQWRAWVFLLLNLVLLAVVFSSIGKNGDTKSSGDQKQGRNVTMSDVLKCDQDEIETEWQLRKVIKKDEHERKGDDGREFMDGHESEDDELNARVEAFIVMFRQHLVTDAKITSRRKQQ